MREAHLYAVAANRILIAGVATLATCSDRDETTGWKYELTADQSVNYLGLDTVRYDYSQCARRRRVMIQPHSTWVVGLTVRHH